MTDELAARRAAVRERLAAKRRAETIERLMDDIAAAVAADHIAAGIEASKRTHPSTPRIYDREAEG